MKNKFEQSGSETHEDVIINEQPVTDLEVEKKEVPIEERVDAAIDSQDKYLIAQEYRHDKKTLSGWKKFVATAMLMSSSLLAVGCNAESQNVPKPEGQKVEHKQESQKVEHRQTWNEYVKQHKKHNPTPWQRKHATPEEAGQVREANGDLQNSEDNKPLHSEKTTSPEAEDFLK
jgi:hypothetical protein